MTAQFEQWWRDVGQFIPPCDRMEGEQLEPFKKFASEAVESMRQPWDDNVKDAQEDANKAEDEASKAEAALDSLTEKIKGAIENHTDTEAIALIQKELNEVA